MPPKSVREEEVKVTKHGLTDGGKTVLRCSNCDAQLVTLLRTNPDFDFTWKFRAKNCCWCDESPKTAPLGGSYDVVLKGGFYIGGTGVDKPDDPDDGVGSTGIPEYEAVGDTILLTTRKANADARPIY